MFDASLCTALDRDGRPVPPGLVALDVPGAPFSIGQAVRIRSRAETLDPDDECFDAEQYAGRIGRVCAFRFECVAGERFPDDPLIQVCLEDGTKDLFWSDELAPYPSSGSHE